MSEQWKYIIFSDGAAEYPVIFHKALSHKDMAEGGLVAGISGWSKVMGQCKPVAAGFVYMPELTVDDWTKSESLKLGPRPQDQALLRPTGRIYE